MFAAKQQVLRGAQRDNFKTLLDFLAPHPNDVYGGFPAESSANHHRQDWLKRRGALTAFAGLGHQ